LRDERLAPFPRTKQAVAVHRREYYAIISHLDDQIGRVLKALDASGKADSTWIFFTADHGLSVGHHGLVGKQNQYDHSIRVPFVVVGPGVSAGITDPTPMYLQDVMPTTLELAGVKPPEHVFFKSLLPRLTSTTSTARKKPYESIYGSYLKLQRSITHDGWKLIMYPDAQVIRLYHVQDDPHETIDLAGRPEHADQIMKLFDHFIALQSELQDPVDVTYLRP
jgi:choline-sulfatase